MKKLLILSVTLFAVFFTTKAQLLYEISGNSVNAKSYLLATNQLTEIEFLDTIPNLFKCFGRCQNVITEMQYDNQELQNTLTKSALLPDKVSLRSLLTVQEYNELSEATNLYLNIPLEKIERLKPIYITELIKQQLLVRWANYNTEENIELFVQIIAKETEKEMIGLDDTGEIIYMTFEREQMQQQIRELLRIIRSPEKEIKQHKIIASLYRQGKLNEIAYQVAMPDNQTTISYSDYKMYCARNTQWVKKLEPYLKEGNQFIALNCIYLGGDEGLISQLRKAGYKVKAVNRR